MHESQALSVSPKELQRVDPWLWAYYDKIRLVAGEFSLPGHEFQVEMMQETHRREAIKKATQMVGTETQVLKSMHGMINKRYPLGILYLFPTADDVADFSDSRFKPLIDDNPLTIGRHVKETNRTNLKRIGSSFLYFRGARLTQDLKKQKRTSTKLKSIPVDKVVFDELDEMSPQAVAMALRRMSHSEIKEEVYMANPTLPDYGIELKYQESDQRVWMIKCDKCNKYTCLELEFPECLHRTNDNRVIRLCVHCRDKEIFPRNGQWVAQYPDRSKDMVGRWLSHLISSFIDPKDMLDAFENPNTDIQEFYNLDLGMGYVEAENHLSKNDVYACCGPDAMCTRHSGPCAMGVDVGKVLYVVIGCRESSKSYKIVKLARVSNFSDIHDLAKRFNVVSAVIDMEPETRKAREFQKAEGYKILLCDYQERLKTKQRLDQKEGIITVRRTETCDGTHDLIKTVGQLELPRRSKEVEQYALEMSNMAKVLKKDEVSGSRTYTYIKLGVDHYRHTTNYFKLAAVGLSVISSYAKPQQAYQDTEQQMFGG